MPTPINRRHTTPVSHTAQTVYLREGSHGAPVRLLQTLLERAGHELGDIAGLRLELLQAFGSACAVVIARASTIDVFGLVRPGVLH